MAVENTQIPKPDDAVVKALETAKKVLLDSCQVIGERLRAEEAEEKEDRDAAK